MPKYKINSTVREQYIDLVKDPATSFKEFTTMPRGYIDDDMCFCALTGDLDNYQYIPKILLKPYMTKFYIGEKLKINPRFFKKLSSADQRSELCLAMFELDHANFVDIKDTRRITPEMYRAYVINNPVKLTYLPPELKTYDLCKLAIAIDGLQLKHAAKDIIPPEKWPELCHMAMTNNPNAFKYVPLHLQTVEYAKMAVKAGFVPDGNVRPDLLPAVQEARREYIIRRSEAVYQIPESTYKHVGPLDSLDGVTYLEYKNKVTLDGSRLGSIPAKHRTKELCELALQTSMFAYNDIPAVLRTPEMYQMAINRWPMLLEAIPKAQLTWKVMKAAVDNDPSIWRATTPADLRGRMSKYVAETYPEYF